MVEVPRDRTDQDGLVDVPEADAAEQAIPAIPGDADDLDTESQQPSLPNEADSADAWEQSLVVPDHQDDYDYYGPER